MNGTAPQQHPAAMMLADPQPFYNSSHFSQATFANRTLWLTGKVAPLHGDTPDAVTDEEARLALQNLVTVLDAARDAIASIFTLTTQQVDSYALRKFVASTPALRDQRFPAWSAVGLAQVALPGIVVEVKVTIADANHTAQVGEL